ncbi:MAG: T9SS type A sorting domain-containing protein [Candidatus Symbiothrix sp.]|nr:T9SS type A sorting domain-containing protein [Candidatus Symbiothrix sp.]
MNTKVEHTTPKSPPGLNVNKRGCSEAKPVALTVIALLIFAFTTKAQSILGDFETGGVNPTFSIEENALTTLSVVDNPSKNGLNTTNKALYGETANNAVSWWAGVKLDLATAVTVNSANRYLHILLKTTLPVYELVLFYNNGGSEKWMGQQTPASSDWFDYVVDMNSIDGQSLSSFRIVMHLDQSAQYNKEIWVDEILVSNSPDPRALDVAYAPITIDAGTQYQTIESFAASDCWLGQYVGKYWQSDPKNTIAKYLFSRNYKSDGSPEGIGLSMWRVNLGAGSIEQGDNSGIEDISRRAECFLNTSGNYDWTKQAGQQFFMQKAKEYGCENFVLFSNSPLVNWTINGKAYSNGDGNANLQSDKYDDFADYLATVAEHFIDEGYNISHISPVNEPQWDWKDGGQEGSPWQSSEIKKLVVELNNSIQNKGINSKILITEAADWKYVYGQGNKRAGNQINEFFNPSSANYVGNLPAVAPVIGGHSYWTETTNSTLTTVRQTVKTYAQNQGIGVYQTEWSLLSETGEGFPGTENDFSYMDVALYMAKVIHADLSIANAASWSYWTALGQERWSHKNRFLLLSLSPNNPYQDISTSSTVADRATLWALGNYSFFIRPGYKRIQLNGANDLASLMASAYIAPDYSQIVAVYVNMSSETKKVQTTFANLDNYTPMTNKVYITSSSYNLKKYGSSSTESYTEDRELSIPARSVTTIVYELQPETAIHQPENKQMHVYPNPLPQGTSFTVGLPETVQKNLSLSLYSSQGCLIYNKSLSEAGSVLKLPVINLKQGVYLLKVQSDSKVFQSKIIVE